MHNVIKKLDKKWGGHKVFWIGVLIFVILLLILGFLFSRQTLSKRNGAVSIAMPAMRFYDGDKADVMYYRMGMSRGTPLEQNIRTASLSIESASVDTSVNTISGIAVRYGGTVENVLTYTNADTDREWGTISLSVPTNYFEMALRDIKSSGVSVISENISSKETRNDTNLKAQIANLNAEEKQYRTLLAKTTNVSEILTIRAALSNVRSKIDALEAKAAEIKQTTDTARILVSVSAARQNSASASQGSLIDTARQGLRDLANDLLTFTHFLILFLFALPVFIFKLALLALALIAVWKLILWVEHKLRK